MAEDIRPKHGKKTQTKTAAQDFELNGAPIEATAEAPEFKRTKRIYKGDQKLIHDLFKLLPTALIYDSGYENSPMLVKIEHSHLFHTIDSSGRNQSTCVPIGGHFHFVEVVHQKDGAPGLKISGPKKWVQKKIRGTRNTERVAVDVVMQDGTIDSHTHGFEYIGSEEITMRKVNVEAVKFESELAAKMAPPIPGATADQVFEG